MDFSQFIKPELLAIIPVLNAIGAAIKKSEKVKSKYIPIILGAISIVIAGTYTFFTSDLGEQNGLWTALFTAIVQGLLCAASSVYANQLYKQTIKTEE